MSKRLIIILLVLVGATFSSCSYKRMLYFQTDKDTEVDYTQHIKAPVEYRLQTNDILYIRFSSFNQDISNLFTQNMGMNNRNNTNNQQQMLRGGNFYFNGYLVDGAGMITMPILGDIQVGGLTMPEVQELIQQYADEYLEEVIVTVRLVTFRVTFLGEVGTPGVQNFYQHELNIHEALASVGGISEYAESRGVLVIRPNETGYETFRVDVTQRDILESEKFFLLPNDIVYVEPLPIKAVRIDVGDLFFYISSITSLLTTALLVARL